MQLFCEFPLHARYEKTILLVSGTFHFIVIHHCAILLNYKVVAVLQSVHIAPNHFRIWMQFFQFTLCNFFTLCANFFALIATGFSRRFL